MRWENSNVACVTLPTGHQNPGKHMWHAVWPGTEMYVPAMHMVQTVALASENQPAGHATGADAFAH